MVERSRDGYPTIEGCIDLVKWHAGMLVDISPRSRTRTSWTAVSTRWGWSHVNVQATLLSIIPIPITGPGPNLPPECLISVHVGEHIHGFTADWVSTLCNSFKNGTPCWSINGHLKDSDVGFQFTLIATGATPDDDLFYRILKILRECRIPWTPD